jgi:hypothetical protein
MTTTTTATTGGKNGRKATPAKSRVPPGETKDGAFVRLAVKRMSAVKAKVKGVKNLARGYPRTPEQSARIVSEFKKLANEVEAAFATKEEDKTFSF